MIEMHWALYVVPLVLMLPTGFAIGYPLGVWQTNRQRDKELKDAQERNIESRKVSMAENAQAAGAEVFVGKTDLQVKGLSSPQPQLIDDAEQT